MVKKDEAFITFFDSFIIYNFLCYAHLNIIDRFRYNNHFI